MRLSQAMRGRHAECAYLLDRAIKNPASTEEFARAAIDAIRLALRPAYAGAVYRIGSSNFHSGDLALAADLDAAADVLARAPRRCWRVRMRSDAASVRPRALPVSNVR
jgi:hypothetical protein